MSIPVYVETGAKRVFGGALEWPGWCRGGRREEDAVTALLSYGPRYEHAIASSRVAFEPPSEIGSFNVVERVPGDATTDFGAPGTAPSADERPLDDAELDRQLALLEAVWVTLDTTVTASVRAELRTGPRGGGRNLEAIVAHARDAEAAYLSRLGARLDTAETASPEERRDALRAAVRVTLRARALGLPIDRPSRARSLWSPRYFVRRAAWHVLDHAWEIEDRALPAP